MLSIELETFNSLFVVVLLSLCIATGGREAVSEDGMAWHGMAKV